MRFRGEGSSSYSQVSTSSLDFDSSAKFEVERLKIYLAKAANNQAQQQQHGQVTPQVPRSIRIKRTSYDVQRMDIGGDSLQSPSAQGTLLVATDVV